MTKIIQYFIAFLDAIVGVGENQSSKFYMNIYDAQEHYEEGLIPIRENNKTIKRNNLI
jgi:hypothetical protein